MNGFGYQPFAGAGLTVEEDGAVTVSNFFDKLKYFPHFIALTNNIMKPVFFIQLGG